MLCVDAGNICNFITGNIKKFRRLILFLIAGGSAATFQLIVYYILSRIFDIQYLLASGISFTLAVIVSFLLQKYVTFENRDKNISGQFSLFFVLALINLNMNTILMVVFVERLGMYDIYAQMSCMMTIAVWSFFIYKYLIFRDTHATPAE